VYNSGVRGVVAFFTIAVLGLAGAAAGSQAKSPWPALHRPLLLKPLATGAACPVTPQRKLDGGRLTGLGGGGPAYPAPSFFSADDRHPGLLASKTIWAWPTRYVTHATPVLVRGMRLDAPGAMQFQLGPQWDSAPVTRELHLVTNRTVGSYSGSTWGTTVTLLLVEAPGCYGLQLDSPAGTSTIVVRAPR
jgi:hypothetical protein